MTISKKEYYDLLKYKKAVASGHVLTVQGLRFICSAYNYDAYRIGLHMLETLGRLQGADRDREV